MPEPFLALEKRIPSVADRLYCVFSSRSENFFEFHAPQVKFQLETVPLNENLSIGVGPPALEEGLLPNSVLSPLLGRIVVK